jgi:hypothetical protein
MKLNRERFLAAAMMLGAASGATAGCKSGSDKSLIGAESNQGPAAEGIANPSWEGNGAGLRPTNEGQIVAPNREGLAPPGWNPTREGGVIAPAREGGFVVPTKEGAIVPPTKEGALVVPTAIPPGWTPVVPNGLPQPPPIPQPAGRPPIVLPKIQGR